jgi:hypothetical protein
MDKAKEKNLPYAVFTVIRILNDGEATVITYEMPPPLFIAGRIANILKQRQIIIDTEIAGEATCLCGTGRWHNSCKRRNYYGRYRIESQKGMADRRSM